VYDSQGLLYCAFSLLPILPAVLPPAPGVVCVYVESEREREREKKRERERERERKRETESERQRERMYLPLAFGEKNLIGAQSVTQ
jgi:hypothetical protein